MNTESDGSAKRKRKPTERKNITDTFVRNAKVHGKRYDVKDAHCHGLTLRIGASGTKTFAYMGRDFTGKARTIKIGNYPDLSVKKARESAFDIRRQLKDPNQVSSNSWSKKNTSEITVRQLVKEGEKEFCKRGLKVWLPRGKKSDRSSARMVIECVFERILDQPAKSLQVEEIAKSAHSYQPKSGKKSANGQASRGLSYLRTVFDWANGSGVKFKKIGAGRVERLIVADLSLIEDPAALDPTITGTRDRVLMPWELKVVLPLLCVGKCGKHGPRDVDLRPIALRFILLTLCRLEEVETVTWSQIDFQTRTWTRQVKSNGEVRIVTHPLSESAIELLEKLPEFQTRRHEHLVFPNRAGGRLDNWERPCGAIQNKSKTENWHRHDLRRTSATIMSKIGVSDSIVDTLLSHKNSFAKGNTSAAAAAYIHLGAQMKGLPDPLRDAVNLLSEVIHSIEFGGIG